MIKKIIFCIILFLFSGTSGQAKILSLEDAKKECLSTNNNPVLNFKVKRGNLSLDNNKSSDILTKMSKNILSDKHKARGLTTLKVGQRNQTNVRIINYGKLNSMCILLKSADYTFAYSNIVVYIANKYNPGSCEYKAVLDHENKHVEIAKNSFEYYQPYIKEKAEEAVKNIKPYFVTKDKVDAALNDINNKIMNYVKPTLDFYNAQRDKKNAELDSLESYAYTQNLCKKW